MPLWWGGLLSLQQQQRRLRINGNNTILTGATMPSWWWQGRLHIDDENNAIETRATMPAWGWQQCHCNESNNAVADQGQQHHCYKGNNTSLTMARLPAHQQWQRRHRYEQSWQRQRCLRIDGNNPITTRATMPAWRQAMRATMLAEQWQRHLHINNGNKAIVMRPTLVIATTAKMPVHWWQWCHHNKADNISLTRSNKGNNGRDTYASTTAMMPSQQWQRCLRINNSNNAIVTRTTTPVWCTMNDSYVILFFLTGLAFWAKLRCPNLPNRERKVWTKVIVLIPAYHQTIVYAIGLVGWRWPHLQKRERVTLAILVWPQTLACFF